MDDERALLRAILANPAEDTPRLIYADCIEERDPQRAAFIRAQCLPPETPPDRWHQSSADCECQTCRTARQEARALPFMAPWLALKPYPAYHARSGDHRIARAAWHPNDDVGLQIRAFFSRGFVAAIRFRTLAHFVAYGPAVFAFQPIERVIFADRDILWGDVGCSFVRERKGATGPNVVPRELVPFWPESWGRRRRVTYPLIDMAHAALSAACVAYGRKLAGVA